MLLHFLHSQPWPLVAPRQGICLSVICSVFSSPLTNFNHFELQLMQNLRIPNECSLRQTLTMNKVKHEFASWPIHMKRVLLTLPSQLFESYFVVERLKLHKLLLFIAYDSSLDWSTRLYGSLSQSICTIIGFYCESLY